jgi:dATP pyrophosphohydrolase
VERNRRGSARQGKAFSIEPRASLWLNPIVQYKQPRSIQVVIFADAPRERHYLLLRRIASHGGFWQSVTGSLEADETHKQAAVREVLEETGIGLRVEELIDLGVVNTFEIAPQWREKYAPGVTHNEEVCFALQVRECEVRVDPAEHDAYAWEPYERAMEMIYWDSNRRALAAARLLLE